MRRALIFLAVALLAPASTAVAAETQTFQSSFDGVGSSSGRFTAAGVQGMAIDREDGLVYVTDVGRNVVDKFDLEGNPLPFSGLGGKTTIPVKGGLIAVDNSAKASHGNVYVVNLFETFSGFGPDGKGLGGSFPVNGSETFPCNLTVGPNGGVFVDALFAGGALEYTALGEATGTVVPISGCNIATDNEGNVFIAWFTEIALADASKGFERVEPPVDTQGGATALAVDPVTDELYADFGDHIDVYRRGATLEGPWQKVTTMTGFVASAGLAFDAAGNLYVAETGVPGDPTTTKVDIFKSLPESAPVIQKQIVNAVRSNDVRLGGRIVAAGSDTSYRIEYGTDSSYGSSTETVHLGSKATPYTPQLPIGSLAPDTTYHFHVVATNSTGTTVGPDQTFKTYATPPGGVDDCPNALARKQTRSRNLLDCRAYELVSARNTDNYDVESLLAPGESPYQGYPQATAPSRALYAVHAGAIPGLGNPTNRGPDPYLATRGPEGWSSRYVGIPADIDPAAGPFSSTLAEADPGLDAFAFAGPELCHPCFEQGVRTGMPLRVGAEGGLTQGLAGSLDPGPSAEPEGLVAKRFSADGKHLVFATKAKLEPDANSNGDLTVYERDLGAGVTSVVSKTASGETMTGPGIAELDVSGDGSRVLVAQRDGEDAAGNTLWRPSLNVAGLGHGVDVTKGGAEGVLFDGMTADGSRVFFTSSEALLPGDGDSAADIYEAEVGPSGDVGLRLVSGAGSAASCDPVANSDHAHWNSAAGAADCGAIAIGGGGGLADTSGDLYFLSPQVLAEGGAQDQANLYVSSPDSTIELVATLEPGNQLVLDSVAAAATRRPADFQTTPDGSFAAFASRLPLAAPTGSYLQVDRYDRGAHRLVCGSCDPSGAEEPGTIGDASLAENGLSLTDDGRFFFTTPAALVLNDTDNRGDVYEMAGGAPQLISSGISQFDSALLSVSADGVDTYFFTHDRLAPAEDENGSLTRIYDARSQGGFFAIPTPPPCVASDECHGAGTAPPAPADIKSAVPGTSGNEPPVERPRCRKGSVRRGGKCVRKKKAHGRHRHKGKGGSDAHR